MIKIAVLSGKGGTGKTMLTAALAHLIPDSRVLADCDVDAANLSILFDPKVLETIPFYGALTAVIDPDKCVWCGKCRDSCRFGAIRFYEDQDLYEVDPIKCEGCGVCEFVCRTGAATLEKRQNGEVYYSSTSEGDLVHAELYPGSGTSGLLVYQVKNKALEVGGDREVMLIDGPPGIGCPVISTLSGTDAVIIATEPSVSSLHDLKRLVTVCKSFSPKMFVVVNRYDLDDKQCQRIQEFCENEGIVMAGLIPFDPEVIDAVRSGEPVITRECAASDAIRSVWDVVSRELEI